MKNKMVLFCCMGLSLFASAQMKDYRYQVKVEQPTEQWHRLTLSERVFHAVKEDYSDLRIFRILEKDTTEIPYVFEKKGLGKQGQIKELKLKKISVSTNKEDDRTFIDLNFEGKVPLCSLKVFFKDSIDFHRDVQLFCMDDSTLIEEGLEIEPLYDGVFSSKQENVIELGQGFVRHLRLVIFNKNDEALKVDEVKCFYEPVGIIGRFEKEGDYFLCFGNKKVQTPEYDLSYFGDKIPRKVSELSYEFTEKIQEETKSEEPNNQWIWLVVAAILILLLVFSLKMLRSNK